MAVAYWPTWFDQPPKPSVLRYEFLTTDPRETKLSVIGTILEAYSRNEAEIAKKNRAFKIAFVLSGVGTALMGGAVIAQVVLQTRPWRQ